MSTANPTRVIGGRYVVLAELGRGGMGIVWRAEDRVMGRHVAVKELHLPQGLGSEDRTLFRERLLREARNAGRLNDPGIVTVYDVVTDDGVDHIVMELIEARTLAEVVAAQGPLDERSATSVARQLLAALRTAHERGVVHRDVKPSNVMLGPGDRVRLTDFGIAQATDDPRLTTTGSIVGSPSYMAPERLAGGEATPGSDLWALGATLFHAAEGASPFARDSTPATVAAVLHADVPPVRVRGPVGTVITGLLQRSTQTRLTGPQAAALLAAPGGDPTAPVDGSTTLLAAAPHRGRAVWVAAALVACVVAGLVSGIAIGRSGGPGVATLTYGVGGDIPEFDVSFAACLQGPPTPGRRFPSSSTVSCTSPHDVETFGSFDPFGSESVLAYPGRAQLGTFAAGACSLLFGSDVVTGPDKDRLTVTALVPSQASFEGRETPDSSFDGRAVHCLLHATDGTQLTGSRVAESS